MKTLIMFYSYTGNCKKFAEQLKMEQPESDFYEIKDKKRASMVTTFMVRCPKAAMRKKVAIEEITVNLTVYDKLIIVVPVWNSHPAPEFNSILEKLPSNKELELYLCSGGGETNKSKEGTCELIKQAGCKLVDYHDVQTTGRISKK